MTTHSDPDPYRILVIDDNPAIHADYLKILQPAANASLDAEEAQIFGEPGKHDSSRAYEVGVAAQGQEGLEQIQAALSDGRPYAMAFVDVRMPPGWDGIETAARLWEADPHLQVVICTAYADHSLDDMVRRLGFSHRWIILKKPFDVVEVRQLANSMTEKWRLEREARAHLLNLEETVRTRTAELQTANAQLQTEVRTRAEAEQALRLNQQMLIRQERLAAIGEVTAGIAHEFNNLLTVILGNTSLALEIAELDPEPAAAMRLVTTSAERAATLIRQLLAFSRQQAMQPEAVQINEVLSQMRRMLTGTMVENIRMHWHLADDLPTVWADAGKLEQAFLNLVINARDAMPRGGDLIVMTRKVGLTAKEAGLQADARPGEFVRLSVADTGSGMDPAVLARIFEPFFTTKGERGTGLGLASVYGTIKQHDGWVAVESEIGRGTTFQVFLPVCGQAVTQAVVPARPRAELAGQESVLLVEDEAAVLKLVQMALRKYGYNVVSAASAEGALTQWQEGGAAFDLLITDVIMPGPLTGIDLAERLRAYQPDLPVVFTSGYSPELTDFDPPAHDRTAFLAKPFDVSTLIAKVRELLDQLTGNADSAGEARTAVNGGATVAPGEFA